MLVIQDGVESFYAPQLPAGASAGFLLLQSNAAITLREHLIDPGQPAAPTEHRWDTQGCVMGRDPAVPATTASGHRLYAAEVDALLAVWGPRFFGQEGTVILYREDTAALEQLVPLAIYTDMHHTVELRRLSLVLWEGLDLVALSQE